MASIFGLIKKRWSRGKAKESPQNEDELTLKALTELKESLSPEQYADQSKRFSSLVKGYFQHLYKIRYKFTYEELIEETGKKRLADDLKIQITSLLESLINTEFDKKPDNPDLLLGQILFFEEIVSRISCIKEAPRPETKPERKEMHDKAKAAAASPQAELPKIGIPTKEESWKREMPPAEMGPLGKASKSGKASAKPTGKSGKGMAPGEEINNIYGQFSKAYEALSDEDLKASRQIYGEIKSYLRQLDEDSKSEFSDELEALEESISQLESEKQAAKLKLAARPSKKQVASKDPVSEMPVSKSQPSPSEKLETPIEAPSPSPEIPISAANPSKKKQAPAAKSATKGVKKPSKAKVGKQPRRIATPTQTEPKKEQVDKNPSALSSLPPNIESIKPALAEGHETPATVETISPIIEEAPDVSHRFEPPTFKHLIDKLFHKKEVILEPAPIVASTSPRIGLFGSSGSTNQPEIYDSQSQPAEVSPPEAKTPKEPTEDDIEKLALSPGSKQLLKENLKDKKRPGKKEKEIAPAASIADEPLLGMPASDSREYLTIEEFTRQVEKKNSDKEKEMTESISPFDRFLARLGKNRKAAEPQVDPQELPRISALDTGTNQISSMVDDLYEQINLESEKRLAKKPKKGQGPISGYEPVLPHPEDLYLSGDEIESLRKISELLGKIYPLVKKKEIEEARKLWQEAEFLLNNLSPSTLSDISGDVAAIGDKISSLNAPPLFEAKEETQPKGDGLALPPPPPPEESEEVSYTNKILNSARAWKTTSRSSALEPAGGPAKLPIEPKPKLAYPGLEKPKEASLPHKETLPKIVPKPIKKKAAAPSLTDLEQLINSARAFLGQGKLADARQAYGKALLLKRRLKLAPDIKSRIDYELMDLNVEFRLASIN